MTKILDTKRIEMLMEEKQFGPDTFTELYSDSSIVICVGNDMTKYGDAALALKVFETENQELIDYLKEVKGRQECKL